MNRQLAQRQHVHRRRVERRRRRVSDRRVVDQRPPAPAAASPRRGSTLVVVISLLALLSILGITINLYTQQAFTSAQYASATAQEFDDPNIDPNLLFDFGLEQLIIGANDNYRQSALYGGRHSILPNLFGRDLHPYSGQGINLVDLDGNGASQLDQNFNGLDDTLAVPNGDGFSNQFLFTLNNSAAAHAGGAPDPNLPNYPDPDPDYTRPDVNASYLGFSGYVIDSSGRPVKVELPSFFRPQLLRQAAPNPTDRVPIRAWQSLPATVDKVLRPHAEHLVENNPLERRFVLPGEEGPLGLDNPFPFGVDNAGIWNMESSWTPNKPHEVGDWLFPQGGNPEGHFFRAETTGTTGTTVPDWNSIPIPIPTPPPANELVDGTVTWRAYKYPQYAFDADPDKDGVKDGIWLDLGFPVQERGDKKLYVPMFSFRVLDADQLVNLNAHGNTAGNVDLTSADFGFVSGMPGLLSQSNHGATPYEVNPGWVLNADPTEGAAGDLDRLNAAFTRAPNPSTFDGTSDWRELANAELFAILNGLPHYDTNGNPTKINVGRYGDGARIEPAYRMGTRIDFPMPGVPAMDDDNNLYAGEFDPQLRAQGTGYGLDEWVRATVTDGIQSAEAFLLCTTAGTTDTTPNVSVTSPLPSPYGLAPGQTLTDNTVEWMIFSYPWGTVNIREFGHPYDIRGSGYIHGTGPDQLRLTGFGPNRWLHYGNTGTRGFNKWFRGGRAPIGTEFLSARFQPFTVDLLDWEPWVPNELILNAYEDDPMEMFTGDPLLSGTMGADAAFTPSDAAFLQHSQTVITTKGTSSRLAALAEWNLVKSKRADEIKKRLTPISWDLRNYGVVGSGLRSWERTSAGEFPPLFGPAATKIPAEDALDPIRPALRRLLGSRNFLSPTDAGKTAFAAITQQLMSANHVVDLRGPGPNHDWDNGGDDVLNYTPGLDDLWFTGDEVAAPADVPPFSRRLTQHPPRPGPAAIGTKDYRSFANVVERNEFEARRDRQLMARDVYVLLYTLCGGEDDVDYTAVSNADDGASNDAMPGDGIRRLYNDDQLAAMAQFAVNLVDAMDPDDVITKFEYDRNLVDGWNLDDNPYGAAETSIPALDLGVVFGVEEQTLTFSESMVIQARRAEIAGTATNHERTYHDDTDHRDFTFLELRNAAPHPVGFGNEAWKIVIQKETFPVAPAVPTIKTRHLVLRDGGVGGGGLFTIAAAGDDHDPTTGASTAMPPDTQFAVDLKPVTDGMVDTVVVGGGADLDLIRASDETRYYLYDANSSITDVGGAIDVSDPLLTTGDSGASGLQFKFGDGPAERGRFLEFNDPETIVNGETMEFVLMRRAHPHRQAPQLAEPGSGNNDAPTAVETADSFDNPWITVDRMRCVLHQFEPGDPGDPNGTSGMAYYTAELDKLQSTERAEPLVRDDTLTAKVGPVRNTLGGDNDRTTVELGGNFRLVQFHFDRDFTSPIDLFTVPLFGPRDTTHDRLGLTNTSDGYPRNGAFPNTAGAARFLHPLAPGAYGSDGLPGDAAADDNGAGGLNDWGERGQGTEMDEVFDPLADPANDFLIKSSFKYDNRWYRLLALLGTPSPMIGVANQAGDYTARDRSVFRLPGRINWNTLSYPEVLAAVIDDEAAFEPYVPAWTMASPGPPTTSSPLKPNESPRQDIYLADAAGENRDWWTLFLANRDGIDPYTDIVAPGSLYGSPYRSASFLAGQANNPYSLEETMLRGNPLDDVRSTEPGRRMFELGTQTQRFGSSPPPVGYNGKGGHLVDLHSRHKLLSRAWGNSTTRSNVLLVYLQVDFFEVANVGTAVAPIYRIGGKMLDTPTHRGFFVIDRTRAYDTLTADSFRNFPAPDPLTDPVVPGNPAFQSLFSIEGPSDPNPQATPYNFRQVIVHREVIE